MSKYMLYAYMSINMYVYFLLPFYVFHLWGIWHLSGTVDWTIHNCILRGGETVLSEAVHAVGEVLGSTLLDHAFMAHLREEVGDKVSDH